MSRRKRMNSQYVFNEDSDKVTSVMEHLTLNLDGRLVREEQLDGEDYLVVPSVAMTEGIHNGSKGKLYYSGPELKKWSPSWNHKPLVKNHPASGSACTQEYLNSNKVGVVLNMRWDGKQRFEAWFNKKRTEAVEPRIITALNNREMMELSTGLLVDVLEEQGVFGSEKYNKVAVNHRPDHIAILPDSIGACSIAKGAGVLQLNELSHEEIRSLIAQAINETYADERKEFPDLYAYVRTVFDDSCVYHFGGKMYEVGYRVKSDAVSIVGDPTHVEQKVSYIPVKNTGEDKETEDMAKKDVIDGLIKNGGKLKEEDRKFLETLTEEQLGKLVPAEKPQFSFNTQAEMDTAVQNALTKKEKEAKEEKDKKEKEEKDKKDKELNPDPTKNQAIKIEQLPPEIQAVYNFGAEQLKAQKEAFIANIMKAPGNVYTAEGLATKDIKELQALNSLATAGQAQQVNMYQPNFVGMGLLPSGVQNQSKLPEPMAAPVYNDEKFKDSRGSHAR